VVTATKSGYEMNFARFGQYISEAIADERADIDKDGQVSLLEAYLTGSSRVDEYYRTHSQLASEHALLDDNGDKLGTPANWFHGIRATKRAKDGATLDGTRAHQLHLIPSNRERGIPAELRQRRDQLELSIAALRDQKEKLGEEAYYGQLEKLMVELARLYRSVPGASPSPGEPGHVHRFGLSGRCPDHSRTRSPSRARSPVATHTQTAMPSEPATAIEGSLEPL
jgi:hypothetical protein